MRLVGFEFRKNFLNPATLLLLLALLLLNAWKIQDVQKRSILASNDGIYQSVYWEFHEVYAGEITLEKIGDLLAIYRPIQERTVTQTASHAYNPDSYTYNDYSDADFLQSCFMDGIEYDYLYINYAYEVRTQARSNMELYARTGNTYGYRVNEKILSWFQNRKIAEFRYTEPWYYYMQYDYSAILVLVVCIFAMAGVFVIEKESEMYMLLRTSLWGGATTTAAKLVASLFFVLLVCGAFWLEDLVGFGLAFGSFEGLQSPIYALYAFRDTPITMTILQFSGLLALVRTAGVLGCTILFLLFSSLCRKVLWPFLLGIAATVGMIYMQGHVVGNLLVKCLNPLDLVIGRELFYECRFANILGYPVVWYRAVIGGALVFYVILGMVLVLCNRSGRRSRRIRCCTFAGQGEAAKGREAADWICEGSRHDEV